MAHNEAVDVVLVGAGIIECHPRRTAQRARPGLKLEVVEQMDSVPRKVPTRGTTQAPVTLAFVN